MSDLIKLYNPANASALTPEQTEGLQKLSSTEIKELALAYPNMTMQRAYLLIIDSTKAPGKQLPTLSSFENLWNLREKNGLRNYVAYGFKGVYKSTSPKAGQPLKAKKTEVLDLSETELMSLPGFKPKVGGISKVVNIPVSHIEDRSETPTKVKVTKIKKVPVKSKTKSK